MIKRAIVYILSLAMVVCLVPMGSVHAETNENTKTLKNIIYEFGEDDDFDLPGSSISSFNVQRFKIKGKISGVSTRNGVDAYAVDVDVDDNLEVQANIVGLPESIKNDGWEVVENDDKKLAQLSLMGRLRRVPMLYKLREMAKYG
ncbi:hypothetical protein SAMN05421493_1279 [Pseudobutyrivibrio sp. 49]|uniref:hypothetical protein n=1 Tax=Pseudobutyrivibrio sp. 49 TaxID=1855344 RepID=UPI00088CCB33|nr:hypothetical protein [Pseudobutyrivibrio sp. 49]SDI77264.1 hypothetical protein SAMN05421493_1279 [Pseudobutyrivibrio sp. 49]